MLLLAAICVCIVLTIRQVLIVVEVPHIVLWGLTVFRYLMLVALPVLLDTEKILLNFEWSFPGSIVRELESREAAQWLDWNATQKAERKANEEKKDREIKRRQDECVHEPGRMEFGVRRCPKCWKALEFCAHDMVVIARGYKEEWGTQKCRKCGHVEPY